MRNRIILGFSGVLAMKYKAHGAFNLFDLKKAHTKISRKNQAMQNLR